MSVFLFLDMDGVMTSSDYMFGPRRPAAEDGDCRSPYAMIDPATIPRLNAIVEPTGARVVITSSWRLVHKIGIIANALMRHGFTGKVVGKTGYSVAGDSRTRRGIEIQDWLDKHAGREQLGEHAVTRRIVILDDDRDMGPLLPWLVQTTWQSGLLDDHVPLALKILQEGP